METLSQSGLVHPPQPVGQPPPGRHRQWVLRGLRWTSVGLSAALYLLHFLHLSADFPNDSPWSDWSKYTDEGWYSDAAVRHFLFGHWNFPGDFNPAAALPVWPLLESLVFRFTGVSVVAARALTVTVFGVLLVASWWLVERFERLHRSAGQPSPAAQPSLAAPLAVLFLCASPFFYVFERMAILEPLLATLAVLSLLAASYLVPWHTRERSWHGVLLVSLPAIALGLLLPAMILTKPTAVALLPSLGYLVWYRAGFRLKPALSLGLPPALLGAALWLGYFLLLVRPRFLEDYEYLFSANAYTGFQLEPLAEVVWNTLADGHWMGAVLYPLFFVLTAVLLFLRPRFFHNPLVPALLLWMGGYFCFLAYHNNLQPRYYLILAVPVTILVALALEEIRKTPLGARSTRIHGFLPALRTLIAATCALAIVVPDLAEEFAFLSHPEYTFEAAAEGIARIVRAQSGHSPLLLSISGSDLTLMTGLPSIDDDFGTLDLDQRIRQYRPGWFVAWNELDDDKMDAMQPVFHPVRVASFPTMDDPERNLLILYRLDPGPTAHPTPRHRRQIPRPLRTKLGQQPPAAQLQH